MEKKKMDTKVAQCRTFAWIGLQKHYKEQDTVLRTISNHTSSIQVFLQIHKNVLGIELGGFAGMAESPLAIGPTHRSAFICIAYLLSIMQTYLCGTLILSEWGRIISWAHVHTHGHTHTLTCTQVYASLFYIHCCLIFTSVSLDAASG